MDEKILIVEDDPDIADLLELNLRDAGYRTELAKNGLDGARMALENEFDLVCLDIMLPKLDGMEVLKRIREGKKTLPVLMLTAKSEEFDKVLGLELGADDYITKPFSLRELLARVKAILRRVSAVKQAASSDDQTEIHIPGLSIFLEKRKIILHGNPVDLTAKEFDLLALFATHPGRAYSRQELLDIIWGYQFDGYDHTVNSHINRLRSKIERDPSNPMYVKTVWGVGYRFVEPEELAQ